MIVMWPVHPLDSFTAEHDLEYYKEISFKNQITVELCQFMPD